MSNQNRHPKVTKCMICGQEFYQKFGNHLRAHNMNVQQYYDKFIKTENDGKCLVCGQPTTFYKFSYGYRDYCSRDCQTKGSIEKFGSYNNRIQAKQTCIAQFNGKMNDGAWKTRNNNIEQFEKEHNCTSTKKLQRIYGNGWKTLNLPKIMINKQNSAISNDYIPIIAEYSNTYHNSLIQQELVDYIKLFYNGEILQNNRQIIKPQELDIYLPDLNIAIEFNGMRWHSIELGTPKDYHVKKSLVCKEKGVRLIHIYEFENIEEQKQLLKDLILGQDNYNKLDANKNNFLDVPIKPQIIYKDKKYTVYGVGKLYQER